MFAPLFVATRDLNTDFPAITITKPLKGRA